MNDRIPNRKEILQVRKYSPTNYIIEIKQDTDIKTVKKIKNEINSVIYWDYIKINNKLIIETDI